MIGTHAVESNTLVLVTVYLSISFMCGHMRQRMPLQYHGYFNVAGRNATNPKRHLKASGYKKRSS